MSAPAPLPLFQTENPLIALRLVEQPPEHEECGSSQPPGNLECVLVVPAGEGDLNSVPIDRKFRRFGDPTNVLHVALPQKLNATRTEKGDSVSPACPQYRPLSNSPHADNDRGWSPLDGDAA